MKLVIDIPDKSYENINNNIACTWCGDIMFAVRNGTPLPKGHRRLIIEKDGTIHEES